MCALCVCMWWDCENAFFNHNLTSTNLLICVCTRCGACVSVCLCLRACISFYQLSSCKTCVSCLCVWLGNQLLIIALINCDFTRWTAYFTWWSMGNQINCLQYVPSEIKKKRTHSKRRVEKKTKPLQSELISVYVC